MKIKFLWIDWVILVWLILFILVSVILPKSYQNWWIIAYLVTWSILIWIKPYVAKKENGKENN